MTEEAKKRVEDNLNLVYSIAKGFLNGNSYDNYEDIVSEGFLGLCHAAERYDDSCGTRFSTYAYQVIRGYMLRYIRLRTNGPISTYIDRHGGKEVLRNCEYVYLDQTIENFSRGGESQVHDLIASKDQRMDDVVFIKEIIEALKEKFSDDEVKMYIMYIIGFESKEIAKKFMKNDRQVQYIIRKLRYFARKKFKKVS